MVNNQNASLRILQLVQKPQRRGAEVFAHQLSQALRRRGHTVGSIYLYPYEGPAAIPLGAADTLLGAKEWHPFEKFPGVHLRALQKLMQIIDAFQPDVVQVNGARTVKYGAFARLVERRQEWSLVYRNIGNPQDWLNGWHYRFFYQRLVMPQLDGVIGVSQATLQNLQQLYDLQIPMVQIPNGVNGEVLVSRARAEIRQQTQTPADAPVLLFVGSMSHEKRLDRLLRVVKRIQPHLPTLHLWLVGDGPERASLEEQARRLGLIDFVHFLGMQNEVAEFMHAADLFVLTSDTEGIPAVILEAGIQGLPTVATRVGGLGECIREGETGILIDPEDEAAFANAVCTLLADPQQQRVMGERAQTWVRQEFTMETIAQQYLAFYKTLAQQRQCRAGATLPV